MADNEQALFETLQNMPYSLEAEQSVLGALLLEPDQIGFVLEQLPRPEMFYRKQHRELFAILCGMFSLNKTIDFVTVLDEAVRSSVFDNAENAKLYLVQLMELVPTTANLLDYCRIVREKYYLRALITACTDIAERSRNQETEAEQVLEYAEQRIYDIRQGKDPASLTKIDTVILEAYDRLTKMSGEDKDKYLGLRSGFSRLDMLLGGLNRSDLILLAARPGMGKSSFAMNIALNVARRYPEKSVVMFSLEMSNEQLVSRAMASEARIDSNKLRIGRLNADEWVQLASCADILSRMNFYFSDAAGVTVNDIKAKLMRLKDVGLVIIDYLQLMSSGRRTENRVQEISQMTRNLKIMAKELDVPVILLSQLSRAAEQRQGHKPMLSDLRDSGSIEQDADIVLFLYRDTYYKDGESSAEEAADPTDAQCIIAKNRHGSTGELDLRWIGEFTRFEDVERFRDDPG